MKDPSECKTETAAHKKTPDKQVLDSRPGVTISFYKDETGLVTRIRAEEHGTLIVDRPAYGFEEALYARSATLLTPAWLVRAGGDCYQTWLCNGPEEVRKAFCEALYGDVESAEADDIDGYMKEFSRPWEDREMRWSFEDGWLEVIALHDQTRYVNSLSPTEKK